MSEDIIKISKGVDNITAIKVLTEFIDAAELHAEKDLKEAVIKQREQYIRKL